MGRTCSMHGRYKNEYKNVIKPERRIPLGRFRCRFEDNSRVDLMKI
jgi:hypothetical protein